MNDSLYGFYSRSEVIERRLNTMTSELQAYQSTAPHPSIYAVLRMVKAMD